MNNIKHYLKLNEPYRPELTVFRTSEINDVTLAMYSNGFSVQIPLNLESLDGLINALMVAKEEFGIPFDDHGVEAANA